MVAFRYMDGDFRYRRRDARYMNRNQQLQNAQPYSGASQLSGQVDNTEDQGIRVHPVAQVSTQHSQLNRVAGRRRLGVWKWPILAVVFVVLAGGVALGQTYFNGKATPERVVATDLLLPSGKTSYLVGVTEEAGGKVSVFKDKVGQALLTIREQRLSEQDSTKSTLAAEAASTLNTKDKVETDNGTAYIASDIQAGTQTVIFGADKKLIFIQSDKRLEDADWQIYINALK